MDKIKKVMHEFKEGELHSGSKHGPEVTNRKQAIAIAMSEARKSRALQNKIGDKTAERFAGNKFAKSYANKNKAREFMRK